MDKNWREYNKELIKRGEILIDPSNFSPREEKAKKRGRPCTYPWQLIWVLLFIKFALRLPYRQTEGLARELFSSLGLKIYDDSLKEVSIVQELEEFLSVVGLEVQKN